MCSTFVIYSRSLDQNNKLISMSFAFLFPSFVKHIAFFSSENVPRQRKRERKERARVREVYVEEVPKKKKTRSELKDLGSVRVTMNERARLK